jgi:hypothetical protein
MTKRMSVPFQSPGRLLQRCYKRNYRSAWQLAGSWSPQTFDNFPEGKPIVQVEYRVEYLCWNQGAGQDTHCAENDSNHARAYDSLAALIGMSGAKNDRRNDQTWPFRTRNGTDQIEQPPAVMATVTHTAR